MSFAAASLAPASRRPDNAFRLTSKTGTHACDNENRVTTASCITIAS